jgi:hypothetical protein
MSEPMLTTCCGQSFCRVCLDAALQRLDACPMCRVPLLSGLHAMTRNRALDELLQRMTTTASDDAAAGDDERDILLTIREKGGDEFQPSKLHRLNLWLRDRANRLRVDVSLWSTPSVRLQQWRHWLRIHWSTLQCVFYVFLFGVFVFFLRVQEEEFAEHDSAPHHRLRHTGGQ